MSGDKTWSIVSAFDPSLPPVRLALRLDDGYETGVWWHQARGGSAGPGNTEEPPGGSGKGPVVVLHGIQSHPGWFTRSADALAGAGHDVFQIMRRGSGDNSRDRGHADSDEQLLRDVDAACAFAESQGSGMGILPMRRAAVPAVHDLHGQDARATHGRDPCGQAGHATPESRVSLVGISWGGKLAACFAAWPRRKAALASLTLVAPGIVPRVDVGAAAKLAIAAALVCCPRRLFDVPLSDVELFTDNPAMRQYLRDDSCRLHQATARFLYVSRRLDRMLSRSPAGCLKVPTAIILASRDRIIDNARTRSAVQRLCRAAPRVMELEGAHTLEFEPDPSPLIAALAEAVR